MVSPLGGLVSRQCLETIIEEEGRKPADLEGEVWGERVDDLPWGKTSLVRIGTSPVEVELVEGSFGQEVSAAGEGFQVEELVFDQAVDSFDIGLIGVGAGRDAFVLGAEVGDRCREVRA